MISDITAHRLSKQLHEKDAELIRLRAENNEMETVLRLIDAYGPATEADAMKDGDLGSYRQALRARLVLERIRRAREESASEEGSAA